MEWYYFFIICVCAIMLLLCLPLFVQVRFYINILENIGAMSIILFGIFTIYTTQFNIEKNAINIIRKNEQNKLTKKQKLFIAYFIKSIYCKLAIYDIFLWSVIGDKNDAMNSAIINGLFITFNHILLALAHNSKRDFVSNYVCDTDFQNDNFKIAGYCSISFSVINIITAIFKSKIRTKKVVNNV